MSHLGKCDMKLKCSLGELVGALKSIMPEWSKYMEVDESGRLPCKNSYDDKDTINTGFSIRIRGGAYYNKDAAPNLPYADAGFRQKEDGSWEAVYDPSGLPSKVRELGTTALNEVAGTRVENYLTSVNAEVTRADAEGADRILEVIMDVGSAGGMGQSI